MLRNLHGTAVAAAVLLATLALGSALPATAQIPHLRKHEADWVNAVAVSGDGSLIAGATQGDASVYRNPDGNKLVRFSGHTKYVQGVAFSPDNTMLYTVGWDGLLLQWPVTGASGVERSPQKRVELRDSRPQCVAVSPDGTRVIANGEGSELDVYAAGTFKRLSSLTGLKAAAVTIGTDAARNRIVAGDKKGNIAVWDLASGEQIARWGAHGKSIAGLAVDSVNGDLLSVDTEGEIKRWRSDDYRESQSLKLKEPVRAMAASPDGRFVYVALKTGRILLLDRELQPAASPLVVIGRPIGLALDDRGRYLCCGTDKNELYAWDLLEIRAVQIAYDTPAQLEIEADFDDSGALIPNRALDGGENVQLHCRIRNVGQGIAYDTSLRVECDNPAVRCPASLPLGDLMSGAVKEVTVPVRVALDARDGRAEFLLHVAEKKKNDARTALGVSVRFLPKPDLEVTLIQLDDQNAGSTSGNNNRVPENGETIEVEFFVRNNGSGPAWKNRLELTGHTPGVQVLIGEQELPPIPAGGATSGRVRLQLPKTFDGESVFVEAKITDTVTGHALTAGETWSARQNTPQLAADWRVIQELRNGRSARIQLRLLNHGTMDAENLDISVSNDQALPLRQSITRVPRVSAGSEDPGVVLDLEIPRDFQQEQVVLRAKIDQANFPPADFSRTFDIALARPQLVVRGLEIEPQLVQGGELYLDLYVQNNGALDAAGVEVSVVSRALELNRNQYLDVIPSNGGSRSLEKIIWPVKTGTPPGPVDLVVHVTQQHFPPVEVAMRPTVAEARIARQDIQSTEVSGGLMAAAGPGGGRAASGRGAQQGIEIDLFGLPEIVHDPNQRFELIVTAPMGIDMVETSVNGQLVYSLADRADQRDRLQKTGGQFLQTGVEMRHLRPGGENRLEIRVVDVDKETRTLTRALRFEPLQFDVSDELDLAIDVNTPPQTRRSNPDAVALLIGVSKYRNRGCDIPPVEFARQDVLAVKQTLIRTLGYRERNIIVLLDEDATGNTIYDAIESELAALVTPGRSDVFVYYCGHGAPSPDWTSGYLVPYDANPSPQRIQRTGIALEEFYGLLGEIQARSMVVALDACFSGRSDGKSAPQELIADISPTGVAIEGPVSGNDNCVVFSASAGHEISTWYRNKKHGLFTYYFLKGLQGEAGQGRITAGELNSYVQSNVKDMATRNRGITQTPMLDGREDFVVFEE